MKLFEAPTEDLPASKPNKRQQKEADKQSAKYDGAKKPDIDELKKKFLKKK